MTALRQDANEQIRTRATAIGFIAIGLWSTSVGLMRSITEHFGATGGAALLYTISALALCLARGIPRLRQFSARYLWIGGALFVGYEIALALSIGLAHTRSQSLELGMINYLWPSLTVFFAVIILRQRCRWWLWPGLFFAIGGVTLVLAGDGAWSPLQMWRNMNSNPLAYSLAFSAAFLWALYCTLTRLWSDGVNGVSLFFCATALVLWAKFLLLEPTPFSFTWPATTELLFMGISTAVAYSAWNYGLQFGNIAVLASASYFTPVLSALVACLWLNLVPGLSFWQGVAMVVIGSLLCWRAAR